MIFATILNLAIWSAAPKPIAQGVHWPFPVQVVQTADTGSSVREDSSSPVVLIHNRPSQPTPTVEVREILKSYVKTIRHYRGELVDSASGVDKNGVRWFKADFSVVSEGRTFFLKGLWARRSGTTTELVSVLDSAENVRRGRRIDNLYSSIIWEKTP